MVGTKVRYSVDLWVAWRVRWMAVTRVAMMAVEMARTTAEKKVAWKAGNWVARKARSKAASKAVWKAAHWVATKARWKADT